MAYQDRRKHFKTIVVKHKKVNLKRINKQNLINSRKSPKQFWKNIKGNESCINVTSKIKPNAWYQYFKQLVCPENIEETLNDYLLMDLNKSPIHLN